MGARERLPVGRGRAAYAAEDGRLEVLQWARANGCPWDKWTCERAAEGGHLEVLQWARANGCSWDEVDVHDGGVRAGTSRCCSGRVRTAARVTFARANLREGTPWSGR